VEDARDISFGLFSSITSGLATSLGDPDGLLCLLLKADLNLSEMERSVLGGKRLLGIPIEMKMSTYLWILDRRGSRGSMLVEARDRPQDLESISWDAARSDQRHLDLRHPLFRFAFDDWISVYEGDLETPCCRWVGGADGGTIRNRLSRGTTKRAKIGGSGLSPQTHDSRSLPMTFGSTFIDSSSTFIPLLLFFLFSALACLCATDRICTCSHCLTQISCSC
jgi:hypothetical protein